MSARPWLSDHLCVLQNLGEKMQIVEIQILATVAM
jgi:hypothetical protein